MFVSFSTCKNTQISSFPSSFPQKPAVYASSFCAALSACTALQLPSRLQAALIEGQPGHLCKPQILPNPGCKVSELRTIGEKLLSVVLLFFFWLFVVIPILENNRMEPILECFLVNLVGCTVPLGQTLFGFGQICFLILVFVRKIK